MAFRTSKFKKLVLLATGALLLSGKFISDVVVSKLAVDLGWLGLVQFGLVAGAFLSLVFLVEAVWRSDQNPVKKLGFVLILTLVVGMNGLLLYSVSTTGFDIKNNVAIPEGFESILFANLYAVAFGTTSLLILMSIRDIIMSKRRKESRRNYRILIGILLLTVVATIFYDPFESSLIVSIGYGLTIAAIVLNSFRLTWIVYLTKREKLITMGLSFVLFCVYIPVYIVLVGESSLVAQSLTYYSRQLSTFIAGVALFSVIYFGMTFVSTLFHLPTAEAFDRKNIEVLSLHNLAKLITRVFDYNELVDLVTKMTIEVSEAQSSWLEVTRDGSQDDGGRGVAEGRPGDPVFRTVALQNISAQETEQIVGADNGSVRHLVIESRRPVVIDRVSEDDRTRHVRGIGRDFNSLVIVPLVSHDRVIGILYATKAMEFGFDREDVDVISAFADQATMALENSRLIEKSLERERLMKEMLLAQEMQKKLLPQRLPTLTEVEIEALSSPAFEVGGDYYDFTMLDDHHLGVIVGDVSGKGVSAAMFMAEMKGIFQSLSKLHRSPSEFLAQAHAALVDTMDRRTFISLIYAIIDLRDGTMRVARAGHCPMILFTGNGTSFVKPTGLGVGMGTKEFFAQTIDEDELKLSHGDIAVFYTDGVTEARTADGDEFGYERLQNVITRSGSGSAIDVRDEIVLAVDTHMRHQPPEDDLTIVVLKWLKENPSVS